MLGFESYRCARILIAGIEVMPMIRQGQLGAIKDRASSAAHQVCSRGAALTAVGSWRCEQAGVGMARLYPVRFSERMLESRTRRASAVSGTR